ncbi:hypothetical protein AB0C69_33250, partial [Actinomadura sp. NPDC048032]|uniref:hypothetical protein n=1 Tax=Actinomadura sp. NPDC048032 TaxID=3155747 RepID=UPI0033D904F6
RRHQQRHHHRRAGRLDDPREQRAATMFPPGAAGFDPFGRGPGRVETPPGPVVRGEVVHDDEAVDEHGDRTSRA